MLDSLLSWIAAHAWAYWLGALVALFALLATIAAALVPCSHNTPLRRALSSRAAFTLAVFAAFLAFRWPVFFAGPLHNPDEAQWIAGALTLRDGGLPWKNLDSHTSGPLTPYALLLTIPLGLPLNHLGARVLATLFQIAAVLALHATARRFTREWAARAAVLPAFPFWALSTFHDLNLYSSETTPLLLLALGAWVAAGALDSTRRTALARLFGGGVLIGAACFAKPQALPFQAALGGLLLTALWRKPSGPAPTSIRPLAASAALGAGALVPLAVFVGYASLFGLWGQILQFFWETNRFYAGQRDYPWWSSLEHVLTLAAPALAAVTGLLGVTGFCLASSATAWRNDPGGRARLVGSWLLLVVAFLAVATPGRMFTHYVHLFVLPLCWCAAVHLDGLTRGEPTSDGRSARTQHWLALAFAAAVLAWPLWERLSVPAVRFDLARWRELQISPIGARIRTDMRPGDRLVVWGWTPEYHVETGLPQGAREAHGAFIIGESALQERYRWRFLFDLRRNRPRWFVDSVAPHAFAFSDHDRYGHQTWPELRALIARDYDLLACLDGVWIYRRKD
ncbi:MAG TPA: hypothetical protein VK163_15775 [Opitutaceae bacterium]|nr:hypothetical protein [Opitutaceae bacterium]